MCSREFPWNFRQWNRVESCLCLIFSCKSFEFRKGSNLFISVVVCFSKRWIFFRETERDLERETNVYYIKYYTNYISLYKNNWCNSFIEETRNTRGADYAEVDWLDSYARLLRRLILFHKGHCQRRPLPHICLIKGNEETLFTGNGGESFFYIFQKCVYVLLCCLKERKEW